MSTGYGVNKGKDGKYNTLNLTTYKGRSADTTKHSGTTHRHGLQSLGKVPSTRRVPPPASLPSLKSENLGNDPNVNLVPKDGTGWASKTDTQNSQQSQQQQPVSQAPLESQQRPASTMYSQQTMYQASNQSIPNNRNQNSSLTSSGQSQQTWNSSRHSQAGSKVSGAAGGARGRGTTPFSVEFPTLSDIQKEQENGQSSDKSREQQYGPGPSLRPQNVASWREGGGRNLPPAKDSAGEEMKPQSIESTSNSSTHASYEMTAVEGGQQMSQRGALHPGMNPSQGNPNMGPPSHPGMAPNPQYRSNIMPSYMYRPGMHPGMVPPGNQSGRYQAAGMHPGMRYPYDPRVRQMMMPPNSQPNRTESPNMSSIISQSDLKEFDKLDDDEGGWAGMHGEVDYQEKLVFSDDEDGNDKKSRSSQNENFIKQSNQPSSGDKRSKEGVAPPRQAWGPQPGAYGMDQHTMSQWSHSYYNSYQAKSGLMDSRMKPHAYDKRMPPQGQQYPAGQMPPAMYGRPHTGAGPRFAGPMSDPPMMERASPGGEGEHHRRNDKEEAMERARKRKEDEERRMAMQRRSTSDDKGYPHAMLKSDPRYQPFDSSEEVSMGWPPSSQDYASMDSYSHRPNENENMRERMPGDGIYRSHVAGQVGGRNLPPRLANQRHQQERRQQRIPSPGSQSYNHWAASTQPTHKVEPQTRIMKRERVHSGGSEEVDHSSRSRKISEASSQSQVTPTEKDVPFEERRFVGREFYRKDDKRGFEDKRSVENASPSTTGSDREQRHWDVGGSKRSSMKRQSSRDSPISVGSASDSRRGSQKTLLAKTDSGSRPLTKRGSNQSNKGADSNDNRQVSVRTRRSGDKLKLRDFRVDNEDDVDNGFGAKKNENSKAGLSHGKADGEASGLPLENQPWKNNNKASKPIATVQPSTTTTSTMTKGSQQKKAPVTTSTTRGDTELDNELSQGASINYKDATQAAEDVVRPRSKPDTRGQSAREPRTAKDKRSHGYYDKYDRSERNSKGNRQSDRNQRDRRDGNRSQRGPRQEDSKPRTPQERPKRGSDRYENRNRRESRDKKREPAEQSDKSKGTSANVQHKTESTKPKLPEDKPADSSNASAPTVATMLKAAPPTTNVWEERKKQMNQKEVEKNIYIPTEDDRKRTLKETAPINKPDDHVLKPGKDKIPSDSKKRIDDEKAGYPDGKGRDYSDKKYEGKPAYRDGVRRRGSSSRPLQRKDRKQLLEYVYDDRNERRSTRGRGRSRGGSYVRGGGRGRGQVGSLEKQTSAPRGRGRGNRGGYRAPSEKSSRSYSVQSYPSKIVLQRYNDDDYPDSSDGSRSGSDGYGPAMNRRRKVGEASDAEDYSTSDSYSDDEPYPPPKAPVKRSVSKPDSHSRSAQSRSNTRNAAEATKQSLSGTQNPTFTARGEPTRRGRGRGAASLSRGKGRGSNASRSTISAPPGGRSYNDHRENTRPPKNVEHAPYGGGGRQQRASASKEGKKRRLKADKPPRFKNPGRPSYREGDHDKSTAVNGNPHPGANNLPLGDVHSSDVGNEEWETASDNSADFSRKVTMKPPVGAEEEKRSEAKRSFLKQRPSSNNSRGRGGKGMYSDRGKHEKGGSAKMDGQVYALHSVNYSNPAAIEGALRDASLSQDFEKVRKEEQKAKHEELFRRFDLHNYAGVVSVDDLPDVSSPSALQSDRDLPDDLVSAAVDSVQGASENNDDDGFTPVLSKRVKKKKQEEMRKKDKEEKMMLEVVRKAKVKQQQKNRQKLIGKSSNIIGGASGSMKQAISSATESAQSELWPSIDTWKPPEGSKEQVETKVDASISQHDSGVESSVPSSQRNSPGTEAKLSFSHFGVSLTSTSVITSVCDQQVSSTSSVVHNGVGIPSLISSQQSNVHLQKTLISGLSDGSSVSPSRTIGPIGNERMKAAKRSDSVENIASLFPAMNDKNVISFIADNSDGSHTPSSNLFPSDDLRNGTFSPFGEPHSVASSVGEITPRQGFGFSQSDFADESSAVEPSLSSSAYLPAFSKPTSSASPLSAELPSSRSLVSNHPTGLSQPHDVMEQRVMSNFRHQIPQSNMQSGFLDVLPSEVNALAPKAGAKPESDPPGDMTLTPQTPNNVNGRTLEGSIPAPIPMPPPHTAGGPDGDSSTGVRQGHEVTPSASGAGDMGLRTPTSPSIDLNMKMELGRKAWENVPQSSNPAAAQQSINNNESYTYHQSTATAQIPEQVTVESSTMQPVTASLSVTKSSDWQPHPKTPTSSSDGEESWKNSSTLQNPNSAQIAQITQAQDFNKAVASNSSEAATSLHNKFRTSVTVTSSTSQAHQLPVATPSHSGGYLRVEPTFTPAPRLAMQGGHSNIYQTISSTSLATNLHNMQQAYANLPPDYTPSLYANQGYSNPAHAAYSTQQPREFNPPVMISPSSIGNTAVKPAMQNTVALKSAQQPHQAAIRSSGMPVNYAAPSALSGMNQTNLGSAQLAIPRPHGGASPAQPLFIPVMADHSRVMATSQGSSSAMVNQALSAQQRPHSTSFYSHLNQASNSYYAQQPSSQLHRQQPSYQQTIPPAQSSFPQGVYQPLKAISPTQPNQLGLEQGSIWALGNVQQPTTYPPIAPPNQRIRSEGDFPSHSLQYYPQKGPFHVGSKVVPPSSAPGGFGAGKPAIPSSSYAGKKASPPTYSKVSSPSSQDHMSSSGQVPKYTMPASPTQKPYMGSQTEWNKQAVGSTPLYQPNSVQGLLSRPFSSATDAMYQPSSSAMSYSMKPQDMVPPARLAYPAQSFQHQAGWGQPKPPQGTPGLMGSQPPVSLLGKGPRPAMVQTSMMGQRFTSPQGFQSSVMSPQHLSTTPRPPVPFPMKMPTHGGLRMTSPTSIGQSFINPTENQGQAKQNNRSNKPISLGQGKTPPVPTLVRGAGSNLVGKKPTFMPEEVVKSNQASERASLLQSLSAFFPDKNKEGDVDDESTDWSTQVANSSPLPKRRPGMRHPGIEKRKDGKAGVVGSKSTRRVPKNEKKDESTASESSPESIVRPVKKMTLADTKPKKGEVAKIQFQK
ncbi:uncharacterized protein LOC143468718 isoform X2 [Clavelina lepadiformis]|uniref:uncharacterized protein LOC143468718 isoform X2 n=1 Tax=Clavelina lepadiformis TaxID=159417 RepID=UPI0040422903